MGGVLVTLYPNLFDAIKKIASHLRHYNGKKRYQRNGVDSRLFRETYSLYILGKELLEVILRSRDLFLETLSLSDAHHNLGEHTLRNRGESCELGGPFRKASPCLAPDLRSVTIARPFCCEVDISENALPLVHCAGHDY